MGGPFHDAGQQIVRGVMAGMYQAGIDIMYVSEQEVPVDTATLKASGRVMEPVRLGDDVECVIGYGYGDELNPKTGQPASAYAVPVHERMDQRHAPPSKAKFLEDPVYGYASLYGDTIAVGVEQATSGSYARSFFVDHGPSDAVFRGGGLTGDERRAAIAAASRGVTRTDVTL